MKTDLKDFVASFFLILISLSGAVSLLLALQDWLVATSGPYAALVLLVVFALAYGCLTALALAAVSFVWPLRVGDYGSTHPQFTLWKVQHVVGELGKLALLPFFPVFARPLFYSLWGARIGKFVAVGGKIIDPRLTVLEDGCVIGEGSLLTSHAMTKDRFILREIHIGAEATVGAGSILMPGVRVGAGSILLPGSIVRAGTVVPPGQVWGGVPAVRIK
ncbi:MAG: hypothetical protein RKP46_04765 [Candidatus Accumulibacter sp.]|uniref:acyltransferase n=1 Tax=Accumulibacter sp. TaxID=2053492 RepID=UPI00287ACFD0|nr:hypothetical protein [Accumulibacter sp.]MDS4013652.1 hypothetical protein [Accumulibacter sp.]